MSSKSSKSPPKDPKDPRSGSSSSSSSPSGRSSGSPSRDKGHRGRAPARREEKPAPSAKLFVTNIDSKFSQSELDKDLREWFSPFGTIKDIVIKTKSGSANSYCFVQYEDVSAASRAAEELNRKEFKGKELKVEFGRGERKTEDRKSDKCYICHKEGHFAKDCRHNRFNDRQHDRRRDDRNRGRDYYDRDYDRDRRYRDRDRRDYRDRRYRKSYSSSSSSPDLRRRERDRDDYRRHRDSRRSPDRKRHSHSDARRYD